MKNDNKANKLLADSAMLSFTDTELTKMTQEMQEAIDIMAEIKQASTPNVEHKSTEIQFNNLRMDKSAPSMPREDILKNASKVEDGSFEVVMVVE